MTTHELNLVNELKEKLVSLNKTISKFNENDKNQIRINIYHVDWNPMMDSRAIKNAIKFLAMSVSETIFY